MERRYRVPLPCISPWHPVKWTDSPCGPSAQQQPNIPFLSMETPAYQYRVPLWQRNLRWSQRKPDALHMRYICVTHALHMRYTCVTHALHMRYTCVTHALHMRYTCVTYALHMRYTCVTHV